MVGAIDVLAGRCEFVGKFGWVRFPKLCRVLLRVDGGWFLGGPFGKAIRVIANHRILYFEDEFK